MHKNSFVKNLQIVIVTGLVTLMATGSAFAQGVLLINTDILENENNLILDADNTGGDITLQFGGTLNKYLMWDNVNSYFSFNDDINLQGHEIQDFKIENRTGAPACNLTSGGRMYHNTIDTKTFVCDGTNWVDVTAIYTTATKVTTVGSSGADYSDIAGAAGYLNTLSGGIILLSAEIHEITSPVNLSNITVIGKDDSNTTIHISGNGRIDSYDTTFNSVKFDVDSINNNMGINVASGSNSLYFEWVDFDIQDAGDVLIDSDSGVAPTVTVKFIKCDESAGNGTIVFPQASANLNIASTMFVDSRSSDRSLRLDDWNVTLVAGGNVYTTGTIYPVPASSIVVSDDMHLQGAIDSLEAMGVGGLITLLPGIHEITEPLTIEGDDIEIVGYGDSSIVRASGFAATGSTIAAVQVGSADGTTPSDGVVLKDFKLEVYSNIHGIRVAGGDDNQVYNMTVQKMAGASGSGDTADIGIQLLDGVSADLVRPVVTNSRVFGNGPGNYFTDGIHLTSDPDITGVWGYDNRISNALVEGNNVDFVGETSYVFVGADNSSLFNNRGSRMGAVGGSAYGIYMGNVTNVNMNANVFNGSLTTGAIAIGIESFNTGSTKYTQDNLFTNNIIDGMGAGGIGFTTGFQIGSTLNTEVNRNSFTNNSILGASNTISTAIVVRGGADDNSFSENDISGGTYSWDTGINLSSITQDRNLVQENRFINVTNNFIDNSSNSRVDVSNHRATTNPTVNDDINDGFDIGTIWVNTTANTTFISVDSTASAAIWNQIDGSGSGTTYSPMLAQVYDSVGGVDMNTAAGNVVTFNQETRKDSGFTHSNTVNNSRIYLNDAGWYEVSYNVSHESQTNGSKNVQCRIRMNGTTYVTPSASFSYARNTTDEWATNTGSALIQTTASNQYYEIFCNLEGSTGAARSVAGKSWTIAEKK
ncbi:hypothetical protein KKD70_02995 [Patescibacteria group bacterium]|nr:hypothetical protein [Patescibacteria group bacterium]